MVAQKFGNKANSSAELKICILLPTPFDPDMPARPEVVEIYSEYMPRFGHKITWVTPSSGKGKGIQEESFKGVKIYSIPHPEASLLPLQILNLFLYLFREYRLLTAIFKKEKYDIVQVRNDVYATLLALYIRNKYNIPVVFHYSFPKGAYKVQKPKEGYPHYLRRFEEYITRYILHKADLVFPISKWMETELIKEGIPTTKMMPLPQGVNIESFSPLVEAERVRARYSLSDSKVIIYLGTMQKIRQLDILIHSLAQLKRGRQNIKLLMVGDGEGRNDLERLVCELELENTVIFVGHVPYFEVPEFIAVADVAVSPVPPLNIYKVSSPCKLFEYMGVAKPVVANEEIPEHREVIEKSGGGILVPFTPEGFADAISNLLDSPEKAAEMGIRGREWVVENRSYEILARQVEERYYKLLRECH